VLIGFVRIGFGRNRSGELGYAIRREDWGNGYATEAASLMLDFGFRTLRLHRIQAACGPDNEPHNAYSPSSASRPKVESASTYSRMANGATRYSTPYFTMNGSPKARVEDPKPGRSSDWQDDPQKDGT
jgi:hypothetical protein